MPTNNAMGRKSAKSNSQSRVRPLATAAGRDPFVDSPPNQPPGASLLAPRSHSALLLLGFLPLLAMLFHPLYYDEAYTLRNYVSKGPTHIATVYDLPNNHIALNHILWAWTALATRVAKVPTIEHLSPPGLRIGILLPFTALLLCSLSALCQSLLIRSINCQLTVRRLSAIAALLVFAPVVVALHAAQLRAYLPSMALLALLLWSAHRILDGQPAALRWTRLAWSLALPVFLALYLVPSNLLILFPLLTGFMLLLVLQPVAPTGVMAAPSTGPIAQRILRPTVVRPALSGLAGALAAFLAYLPVASQVSRFRQPAQSLQDLSQRFLHHCTKLLEGVAPWTENPWFGGLFLLLGIAATSLASLRSPHYRPLLLMATVTIIGAPTLAAYSAPTAFSRNYCVLAPLVACLWLPVLLYLSRQGAQWLTPRTSRWKPIHRATLLPAALAAFLLGGAFLHQNHQWRTHRPDLVARALQPYATVNDIILSDIESDPAGLDYQKSFRSIPGTILGYNEVNPALLQRLPRLFLVTSTQPTRDEALKLHGLGPSARLPHSKVLNGNAGSAQVEIFSRDPIPDHPASSPR
jgi:hypothetical protein